MPLEHYPDLHICPSSFLIGVPFKINYEPLGEHCISPGWPQWSQAEKSFGSFHSSEGYLSLISSFWPLVWDSGTKLESPLGAGSQWQGSSWGQLCGNTVVLPAKGCVVLQPKTIGGTSPTEVLGEGALRPFFCGVPLPFGQCKTADG